MNSISQQGVCHPGAMQKLRFCGAWVHQERQTLMNSISQQGVRRPGAMQKLRFCGAWVHQERQTLMNSISQESACALRRTEKGRRK